MTRPLDHEDAGTPDNDRFEPHEVAWTGRRRRGRMFALLGGALVLGASAYFTGWHQQVADTRYVSQIRESVQGLICPVPAPVSTLSPSSRNLASAGDPTGLGQ